MTNQNAQVSEDKRSDRERKSHHESRMRQLARASEEHITKREDRKHPGGG